MTVKLKTVEDELNALDHTPHVYQAISGVQGELATVGIAKTRKNTQGSGYMFRGIDDVYAALSPLLAKHKLVVIPRVIHRELIERQSKSGGALFYVTIQAEFDFVSAIDGTTHTAATFGEAMDSGDKATNKAMSAAYKYAAFMTFAIPTEGDNDADTATHEVEAKLPEDAGRAAGDMSKTALQGSLKLLVHHINGCERVSDLEDLLETPDAIEVMENCERRFPAWWATAEGMPAEFVPLKTLIAQTRQGLAALEPAE